MSDFPPNKPVYDKPLPKTALDEWKLALQAPIPGMRKKSTLKVSIANNQPRIMVFTGYEGDPKNGFIMGRLDTLSFMSILEALRLVIKGELNAEGKFRRFDIPCKFPSKGGAEYITDAYVTIGREEGDDGRIFIAVTGNNVTPVKFYFGPTECHEGWLENKQPVEPRILTEIYANAWCRIFSRMVLNALNDNYTPPPPRDPNGWSGRQPTAAGAPSASIPKPTTVSTTLTDTGGSDDDFFL